MSTALVVISMPGWSFRDKIEDRHSSTRLVDMVLAVGLLGVLDDLSGDDFLAGVITVLPPNKDAL
jgi:hypothetical protein